MSDNLPSLPDLNRLAPFVEGIGKAILREMIEDLSAIEADRVSRDVPATPERDAIAVNLLRHMGLNKHKARECADLVLLTLASPQPQPVQPVKQEPVAVIGRDYQLLWVRRDWSEGLSVGDFLYTAPPKAVPLTQPEKQRLWNDATYNNPSSTTDAAMEYGSAIEAHHGIPATVEKGET